MKKKLLWFSFIYSMGEILHSLLHFNLESDLNIFRTRLFLPILSSVLVFDTFFLSILPKFFTLWLRNHYEFYTLFKKILDFNLESDLSTSKCFKINLSKTSILLHILKWTQILCMAQLLIPKKRIKWLTLVNLKISNCLNFFIFGSISNIFFFKFNR